MILYIIPILTALTLIAAAMGIYLVRFHSRRAAERLQRLIDTDEAPDLAEGLVDEALPVLLRPIAVLGWLMPGQIYSDTLYWDLARTGYRHSDARKVFSGLRVISTAVFAACALLITWTLRMTPMEIGFFSLVAVALGYYAPQIILHIQQTRRQLDITLALPDALDLLVICVEAGQGLNAALLKVGKEYEFHARALSDELRALNAEMLAGVTRAQALRNFALRTGVDDVRALVAVMIQSDRFGTSIAQALRIHAKSLRTRRRQRAEESARKTPVKLVFPLVLCIFPELMVVILAPGMLQLFRALTSMNQG